MPYEETEACLKSLPQIRQAAVMLQGNVDQQLTAYITLEPGCNIDSTELYQILSSRLPEAKVPNVYVILDGLPFTEGGELDRQGLSMAVRGSQNTSYLRPQVLSGPAADIADIWREVLGMEVVGLDDDLFDLGGHSLTITRIAARIRSSMGINVALTVFYDTPTILGIASAIEQVIRSRSDA